MDPTASQRWTFLAVISAGLLLIGVDSSILYTAVLREELWVINSYPLMLAGLVMAIKETMSPTRISPVSTATRSAPGDACRRKTRWPILSPRQELSAGLESWA